MTTESQPRDPVSGAQLFFWDLYKELSDGPLEDELETTAKLVAVNDTLRDLTAGGKLLSDGSLEAEYVGFVKATVLSVEDEELQVSDEDNRVMKCVVRYSDQAFTLPNQPDSLQWLVSFELEGQPQPAIFSTTTGQVGHIEDKNRFDYEPEHSRGLVVIANNLATVFSPSIFLQRDY